MPVMNSLPASARESNNGSSAPRRRPRGEPRRREGNCASRYADGVATPAGSISPAAGRLTLRQVREQRQREVEEHIQKVNQLLRESEAAGAIVEGSDSEGSEWGGFEDPPEPEIVDHENEYIDEDKYTTVKVESVSVTRDGLERPKLESSDDEPEAKEEDTEGERKKRPPKKRKKKFRYESKVERQLSQQKIKAKKKARARR